MTREQATTIMKQMNEIVYPSMMTTVFQVARGEMFLNLLKDIVNNFELLFQLPKALEMEECRCKEELELSIDELLSRVMKMLGWRTDDDRKITMMLRNSIYALDRIRQITINYVSEKFPDEENDQKQEVQDNGQTEEDQ